MPTSDYTETFEASPHMLALIEQIVRKLEAKQEPPHEA